MYHRCYYGNTQPSNVQFDLANCNPSQKITLILVINGWMTRLDGAKYYYASELYNSAWMTVWSCPLESEFNCPAGLGEAQRVTEVTLYTPFDAAATNLVMC